ncbi:type III-A CRISPR-associated protein Csm2 [Methylococcus sp. Mc7]|uniref:type III-A CRISPR-associated protein Csm2 n=1 Tax=Methylococcus sp. Mc7 TaxID=2860258 RepID=UPI001C5329A4|nr:type III-A CRISPR-associated protein Csm2 [Methylococcus sp. Mc7]QXP83831.1 type III-A CRISPR-associated protein Csm2 [Methylococcus sp. Mc7]
MADIKRFITSDGAARDMVTYANELAEKIKFVSTSQIRNVYGTVKKLEMIGLSEKSLRQLLLLKPRLAYSKARIDRRNKEAYEQFEKDIGLAIDAVELNTPETFTRFCNFFEAILAYHKAHGGK